MDLISYGPACLPVQGAAFTDNSAWVYGKSLLLSIKNISNQSLSDLSRLGGDICKWASGRKAAGFGGGNQPTRNNRLLEQIDKYNFQRQVGIVSDLTCRAAHAGLSTITIDMLCAGGDKDKDSCQVIIICYRYNVLWRDNVQTTLMFKRWPKQF